jgi:ABC-type transport system involved in multi-copper enzyme maturation permease subunit
MSAHDQPGFPTRLLRFWFRRILPWWFLVASVIFLMQIAVCGIIHDDKSIKALLGFIEMLPKIVQSSLGGDALSTGSLPALIAIGYHHPFVQALYMVFAVAAPTGMLAGEVQGGTMELILSCRVTRTQVYVCAAIVTIVGMMGLVAVMFSGTVAATTIYNFGEPVPLYRFFQVAINGGLLAGAVGAISLLSAAVFHRRAAAVGAAVTYLVVNYFVEVTATSWQLMKPFGRWTIFHYVNGGKVFARHVWPVSEMTVLLAVLVCAAVAGGIVWRRKDLRL